MNDLTTLWREPSVRVAVIVLAAMFALMYGAALWVRGGPAVRFLLRMFGAGKEGE